MTANWCVIEDILNYAPNTSKKCASLGWLRVRVGASLQWLLAGTNWPEACVEAFFVSTGIVALAEMGDKTQLLALLLAARFRKPWPIVVGIFVATIANHAMAGAVGAWVTTVLGPDVLRWVLGVSFIAMAAWMLIPDKADDLASDGAPRFGVFGTTVIAFFFYGDSKMC